jgi:polyisoprenoid-binding protein YceI
LVPSTALILWRILYYGSQASGTGEQNSGTRGGVCGDGSFAVPSRVFPERRSGVCGGICACERRGGGAGDGNLGRRQVHTDIGFTIKHLAVSKVRGHFNDFDGTVVVNGAQPEKSSVTFAIKTASIDTANARRDGHLKGADFFDADKYPEITFKSTKISKTKKGFDATGQLTMHGITKTVVLPFTVEGPVKGPDGTPHMGIDTTVTINRQDYGLTWSKMVEGVSMISNEVDIAISLDLAKKARVKQTVGSSKKEPRPGTWLFLLARRLPGRGGFAARRT